MINKKDVREQIILNKKLRERRDVIWPHVSMLANELNEAASDLLSKQRRRSLHEVPITKLLGLSTELEASILSKHGIDSLQDLFELIQSSGSIPGVDNTEYGLIKRKVSRIVDLKLASTKLTIDFDHYPLESSRLVHYLRMSDEVASFTTDTLESFSEEEKVSDKLLQEIQPASYGRFLWIVTSASGKRERTVQFETLKKVNEACSARLIEAQNKLSELTSRDSKAEKRYFEEKAAELYAQMEALNLPGSKASDFDESIIPKSLSESVQAETLNKTYLKATLRGWQLFGAKYILLNKKVLLGDEMGLGKTVQALAALASKRAEGMTHFLVICPNSIVINWIREIAKHTSLHSVNLHGTRVVREEQLQRWVKEGGVAVCNYESVWRLDKQVLFEYTQFLVADEAHLVKNPGRKRSDFVTSLAEYVPYAVFMTGTALENHVEDMINLIAPLNHSIIRDLGFEGVDRSDNWTRYLRSSRVDKMDSSTFQRLIAPVYLRRNRTDVLKELPPLTQSEEWSEFSSSQQTIYREAVELGGFMAMRQVGWQGPTLNDIPKFQRLREICEEAAGNHEKVLVFSFFRNVLTFIADSMSALSVKPIMGGVSAEDRQQRLDEFEASPSKFVLPAQIDTVGYGLNLQSANVVIFTEPQMKPSTESQALSRAYRMGQTKQVLVYRLLTADSVDERMMDMLNNKQLLFDTYAKDSVAAESSQMAKDTDEVNIVSTILNLERERLAV